MREEIRVLIAEVGKPLQEKLVYNALAARQNLVNGFLSYKPFVLNEVMYVICYKWDNDGLPFNRIVNGTFFFSKLNGAKEHVSLTDGDVTNLLGQFGEADEEAPPEEPDESFGGVRLVCMGCGNVAITAKKYSEDITDIYCQKCNTNSFLGEEGQEHILLEWGIVPISTDGYGPIYRYIEKLNQHYDHGNFHCVECNDRKKALINEATQTDLPHCGGH